MDTIHTKNEQNMITDMLNFHCPSPTPNLDHHIQIQKYYLSQKGRIIGYENK